MEPSAVVIWALGSAAVYGAVGLRLARAGITPGRRHAQDFYILGWYALAATSLIAGAHASLLWGGVDDAALLGTTKLGIVLAFVLAVASLIAAGGYFLQTASPTPSSRLRSG